MVSWGRLLTDEIVLEVKLVGGMADTGTSSGTPVLGVGEELMVDGKLDVESAENSTEDGVAKAENDSVCGSAVDKSDVDEITTEEDGSSIPSGEVASSIPSGGVAGGISSGEIANGIPSGEVAEGDKEDTDEISFDGVVVGRRMELFLGVGLSSDGISPSSEGHISTVVYSVEGSEAVVYGPVPSSAL